MTQLTFDQEKTKERIAALEEYMEENVLKTKGESKFVCKHYETCKGSLADGSDLYEGQLHHVGAHYDLMRDGKPFRIMVSGAEYGEDNRHMDIKTRTKVISKNCTENSLNPHMRGTLLLLQMLFGKKLSNDDKHIETGKGEVPIFDMFSLANFLLCSAIQGKQSKRGSRPGTPSIHMKKYCRDHYQKTLEILEPNIIVLQGTRAWDFFWERYDVPLDNKTPKIAKIEINKKPVLVLPLSHPSYQRKAWGGENYDALKNYVQPAVNQVLEEFKNIG